MIIVSYATKNTPYVKIMNDYLLPSVKKFNLKHDIQFVENRGSWKANTHYKAQFLKQMLLKHKESIVFIDADATIEEYPMLFFILNIYVEYDIALHYVDWGLQFGHHEGKTTVASGTLCLKYNGKVLEFLDDWIEENKRSSIWEQKNMGTIIEKWKGKLKIEKLPPEYCYMLTLDGKAPSYIKEKPVIFHRQVSRKYRRKIT